MQHQPIDRRDGSTKGEMGITSVNNLYCKDQISNSSGFVREFDKIDWAPKDGCHWTSCPFFRKKECLLTKGTVKKSEECKHYYKTKKSRPSYSS